MPSLFPCSILPRHRSALINQHWPWGNTKNALVWGAMPWKALHYLTSAGLQSCCWHHFSKDKILASDWHQYPGHHKTRPLKQLMEHLRHKSFQGSLACSYGFLGASDWPVDETGCWTRRASGGSQKGPSYAFHLTLDLFSPLIGCQLHFPLLEGNNHLPIMGFGFKPLSCVDQG